MDIHKSFMYIKIDLWICNSLLPKVPFLPLFSSTKRISILPGQHKVHFLTLFTGIRWKTAQQLTEVSEF